jgi:hypothetical protein
MTLRRFRYTDLSVYCFADFQMIVAPTIQRNEFFDFKKVNENTVEFFNYTITKFPKPFKDRETVAINRRRVEKDSLVVISFSAVHPRFPVNKKYVRMLVHRSDSVARRISENETELSLYMSLDVQGNFPKWVMKMLLGDFVRSAKKLKQYFATLTKEKIEESHESESISNTLKNKADDGSTSLESSLSSIGEEEIEKRLQEFLEMNGLTTRNRKKTSAKLKRNKSRCDVKKIPCNSNEKEIGLEESLTVKRSRESKDESKRERKRSSNEHKNGQETNQSMDSHLRKTSKNRIAYLQYASVALRLEDSFKLFLIFLRDFQQRAWRSSSWRNSSQRSLIVLLRIVQRLSLVSTKRFFSSKKENRF